jgi:hypothetical protein
MMCDWSMVGEMLFVIGLVLVVVGAVKGHLEKPEEDER